MDATTVYKKTKGPIHPNKAFVTAWRAVMLLFDMRARSPHSIKTCFLEIRCRESAAVLVTLLECFGRSLHASYWGAREARWWGARGCGGPEPNWGRRRQNAATKMSTSETGAIMWRCGAVLSDSNRRVLSHLYTMFARRGRRGGYFERSLCIRLTLSVQNELNKTFYSPKQTRLNIH